jgi:hypothetical protein
MVTPSGNRSWWFFAAKCLLGATIFTRPTYRLSRTFQFRETLGLNLACAGFNGFSRQNLNEVTSGL